MEVYYESNDAFDSDGEVDPAAFLLYDSPPSTAVDPAISRQAALAAIRANPPPPLVVYDDDAEERWIEPAPLSPTGICHERLGQWWA